MNAETLTLYWTAIGLGSVLTLAFVLGRWKGLAWLSPPLIALGLTAMLVNTGLLPSAENNAVYGFVAGPGLLVAIFLLLLQIDIGVFRRAGPQMMTLFAAGAAATSLGVAATLLFPWIGATLGDRYPILSGMYAATYIGGSINFNAVAAIFNVDRQGDSFAVAVAADNLMGSLWIAASILAAPLLRRLLPYKAAGNDAEIAAVQAAEPADYAIAGASAAGAVLLSLWLASTMPNIHPIIWLTAIALVAAQTPLRFIGQRLEPVAVVFLYLFIAAIGAEISIAALTYSGAVLLACILLITSAFIVHGIVIYAVCRFMRADPDVMIVASQAGIGGPPTVLAVADAIGRKDLRIPGVAAGLVGYAIGTYIGVGMHGFIQMMTGN
jgi:uncharacterized membrane protein